MRISIISAGRRFPGLSIRGDPFRAARPGSFPARFRSSSWDARRSFPRRPLSLRRPSVRRKRVLPEVAPSSLASVISAACRAAGARLQTTAPGVSCRSRAEEIRIIGIVYNKTKRSPRTESQCGSSWPAPPPLPPPPGIATTRPIKARRSSSRFFHIFPTSGPFALGHLARVSKPRIPMVIDF